MHRVGDQDEVVGSREVALDIFKNLDQPEQTRQGLLHHPTCNHHSTLERGYTSYMNRLYQRGSVTTSKAMDNAEASFYLSQYIGKPLRIHVSDGRVFGGQMKCTDKVSTSVSK